MPPSSDVIRAVSTPHADSYPCIDVLRTLFNPRSVVVVGVSRDPIKRGRQVLRNVVAGGFAGRVYGVGRGLDVAEGIPCVPNVASIKDEVDVAFLALSAETTADTLRECRKIGVKVAVVGAAGFAENGDVEGIARQSELRRVARETGIRIVGPNCNGIYNTTNKLALGFNAAHAVPLSPGSIAILSHSGALFSVLAGYLDKIRAGISIFVSAGNEADFDILDYLEYALSDTNTKVAALLVDAIPDGERLRRLADRARRAGKRIVALKVGRSELGAKAALAHSSRLAGSAAAYAALFEASGVATVSSLEGLMTTAALLSFHGRADGGLGAFTTSGAGASLVADLAAKHNVRLPELSAATQTKMAPYLQFSTAGNPCDLGTFERGRSGEVPSVVAADSSIGALIALVNPIDPNSGVPTLTDDLAAAARATGKPFAVVVPGGLPPERAADYERNGMHVFPDTECTLEAMGALLGCSPAPLSELNACPSAVADRRLLGAARSLTEPQSMAILKAAGINVVETVSCTSIEQAVAAAEMLGWPVVAKAVVEGVAHKTEAGHVKVDLRNPDELRAAYRSFDSPNLIVVQPFVRGKLEVIAGVTWSRDVGTIVLAGLGGIYAESLRDLAMWSVPVSGTELQRKLRETALGRILSSTRWRDRGATSALIDTLECLQRFAQSTAGLIKAIDINPLVLTDETAIAVDALIVTRDGQSAAE
jgi:acyl-CoA synthetase (NDP forming)